jgi:predicted metal-dependent phosphoesterase TrpH
MVVQCLLVLPSTSGLMQGRVYRRVIGAASGACFIVVRVHNYWENEKERALFLERKKAGLDNIGS